ncbi:proline-rich domain-containing protein [Streptomyces sp. NPDC005202]|uniref:proline-rich domain-containing protein n=1 Tax=Streptomyces sp. NPDC005202 TaxID=3157021 RepID=UPI0033A81812
MSYGDPNNPYGAPQAPQQPGYGYPQGQAPGYGYPQAPPVQQYGAPVPETMPGNVSAARVMLWVIVGLQVLGVALFAFSAATVNAAKKDNTLKDDAAFQRLADYSTGMLWALVLFALAWGVFAAVLAVKFNTGRNGVRVTTMVYGIITAILGLYPFIIVGLVHTVLAILIACFVGGSKGAAWFNRPRY